MIKFPIWDDDRLQSDREKAIAVFRQKRLSEPLELYLNYFDDYQGVFEDLLEQTTDLTALQEHALAILSGHKTLYAFRYLAGPAISLDDLKTVADVSSLTKESLRKDPAALEQIVSIVRDVVDRRRFPWLGQNREPTERERIAAVVASAALVAQQRTQTKRRGDDQKEQEQAVEDALIDIGFEKVKRRPVMLLSEAPDIGQFCAESLAGDTKADFILRLWDGRVMPLECKVSNSSTNSVKRLNREAATKARYWLDHFGSGQIVPAAVISGVYKLEKLKQAQNAGLTIFWSHDVAAFSTAINKTKL